MTTSLDDFDENIVNVNISFDINLVGEHEKEQLIADSFGLGYKTQQFNIYKDFKLDISKQIYYITGDSGSGKSLLLKYLKTNVYKSNDYIDFNDIIIDDKEKLYTICSSLEESIKYLTLIGLGDSFLFLNKYGNLSDGQRTRYKLLKCLLSDKKIIFIDEFLATLDRETAKVVAYNLQRTLRKNFPHKKLFVATTHTDIADFLNADFSVIKLYGTYVNIITRQSKLDNINPFLLNIDVELDKKEGQRYWKEIFAEFHYRSHDIPFIIDIALLRIKNEKTPIGIIVYKHGSYKVNQAKQDTARISRVVMLPKYRGIGLAHHFVRIANTLFFDKHSDFNNIDTVALMANYNPFFAKAGMKEIDTFYPQDDGLKIKAYLEDKGINFFKFRIDKEYAQQFIDEELKQKLTKLFVKKRRSYTSFNIERELPDINTELEKFLGYLEVLMPKKFILTRENTTSKIS